ncbi:MAG TPA: ATP-binding protein [Terriglobia bacterium]|nr:ATP-binding protein [Terriglobia bacterium]
MFERESGRYPFGRWTRLARSLSAKLIALLVAAMAAIFALLGYLNIRLHRQHLETATLASAERVSDVIKRSTSYYMLRNDREGLYHIIGAIADEPGVVRIRIINQQGRISFSTDPRENDTYVDKKAEACYGCHAQAQPLARLNRPDRFRIYQRPHDGRTLGIINPIENSPACSSASCHAHPASQQILGVLDTNLSLERADLDLAQSSRNMVAYTLVAVLLISLLTGTFTWRVVQRPLKTLESGTERLTSGDLGYQIEERANDELGDLAASFNVMSRQLREARGEITGWNRTLEARVEQKTQELNRAYEQMLSVEKMASIGKLAAVVAHEINNPLAGILTYAKLLKKWLARWDESHREETLSSLDLIESESRRCGEIVKNLLTFARAMPIHFEPADLNAVVRGSVRLLQHQLELKNIEAQLDLSADLPPVRCDAAQIEQVLVALIMNAIDAMPKGGNLVLRSRLLAESGEARVQVQDDGTGMSPELLPKLFEPFFTTKERGRGVGLGLAISKNIIERHRGRIEVASDPGRGTTFTLLLPLEGAQAAVREEEGVGTVLAR